MADWPAASQDVRRILLLLLAACALLPVIFAVKLATADEALFPDFFGLWSFGRFVLSHPPATIYDDAALHAFQAGFGLPPDTSYAFLYPPAILLLLAPFGALPYEAARLLWLLLTFAAYAVALRAWRWPPGLIALLILAPSSAVCLLVGQTGFLIAALMLGGLRLLRRRPLLAGALLAVVGCKPQLAPLVPFMLLFGGHWRAMLGAAAMACVLALGVTAACGPDIWGAWLGMLHGHAGRITVGRNALLEMMPTVTSAVLLLRGGGTLAFLTQLAAAAGGLLALWRVRRRDDPEARAVLPLATLLATPYAFHYDLPMVTGAVLAIIAARIAAADRFGGREFPLMLGCIALPVVLPAHVGALAVIVPVIFAATLWTIARPRVSLARPGLPPRPAAA